MTAKALPFLSWIRDYDMRKFGADAIAGLTVAVILVPQGMAYAMLAGLPPVYGLYAGLVGAGIASLFGSSSRLSTGPVAIVSFLVFTSLSSFAAPESPKFIGLAITLAFIVGIIQLLMGAFRLGFIMSFVSHSVIVGFSNAAAIIIASTQIPSLLGITIGQHEFVFETFADIMRHLPETHLLTLGIGATSIVLMLALRKVHRMFPAALAVVILSTIAVSRFGLDAFGIKIVGAVPAGIPFPALPDIAPDTIISLFGTGLVISIIGFMEAFAIAKTIAAKRKERLNVNQELVGQGLANIAVSFFKGFPVSGSFSRSAVNDLAGAKTGMSGILVSVFSLVALLFVTPLLHDLPRAALAAIVIIAVTGLIDIAAFSHLFRTDRNDGIVAVVTFVAAFLMKPDYAIFIGITLSLILFLFRSMKPTVSLLVRDPERNVFVPAEPGQAFAQCDAITIVRPDRSLYFGNIEHVIHSVGLILSERVKTRILIVDCEAVNTIDATAGQELSVFTEETGKKGIEIFFANSRDSIKRTLYESGIRKDVPEDHFVAGKGNTLKLLAPRLTRRFCDSCDKRVFKECHE